MYMVGIDHEAVMLDVISAYKSAMSVERGACPTGPTGINVNAVLYTTF